MRRSWGGWPAYVPVAKRKKKVEQRLKSLQKKGVSTSRIVVQGRTIANTFWGRAWCENLERYSDFHNRLPRGRTYLRNGSVLDLKIAPGEVRALVCGTQIYKVAVKIKGVSEARWKAICNDCAGAIDSLVELLQGRFSKAVMERICQEKVGLFPSPSEIEFACSCPDWAYMCKHVAAVLYGVGARLDQEPELLFRLRQVDEMELIAKAGRELPLSSKDTEAHRLLKEENLSELFGLDIQQAHEPARSRTEARPPEVSQCKTKEVSKATKSLGSKTKAKASSRKKPVKENKKRSYR
ncbi:MAG: SWIM zinc finger family protein [bacterium]